VLVDECLVCAIADMCGIRRQNLGNHHVDGGNTSHHLGRQVEKHGTLGVNVLVGADDLWHEHKCDDENKG
jgi:hypothetical protein